MLDKNVVIAHRGASGYAPEHTFASYDKSHFDMHADYIELDVHMTLDGEIIVMHDESIERTALTPGIIKEMTLQEIKQLTIGKWFNEKYPELKSAYYEEQVVPTLKDIFERYGDANYYIETKSPDIYPGMEKLLIDTLDAFGLVSEARLQNRQTVIQSFSVESLIKVNQIKPNFPLLMLAKKGVLRNMSDDELRKIHEFVYAVGPSIADLDEALIERMHNIGFLLFPYTLNKEEDMERFINAGIDGAFTNYPDLLRKQFRLDNGEVFE
ncbi:glycerophosphodiester phosphodiesterase [Macrococcus armenti]|uniref:glycerophosphodiester phosphodiesterase n=1 Tax=Macrococcus armenti TaxID=2875764 RepID=UPI001CCBED30|nr:glycerophosphodiester phosphodiesterase [Macrococcus armenti]UBH07954.1 glycerophosphodiester phosphodiesterase [Macrococcus armenti]UBH10186.1 glycerophosphodiester phosphodiesterase [Macrococcus armenti]